MTITIKAQADFSEIAIRQFFAYYLRELDSSEWSYESDKDESGRGSGCWVLADYADLMIEALLDQYDVGDLHLANESRAELETVADAVYAEVQPEVSREIDEANRDADEQDSDYRAAVAGGAR